MMDSPYGSHSFKEDERALKTLSDVTGRVFNELRDGSVEGVRIFKSNEFTGAIEFATGGRCEIYKTKLLNKTVAVKLFKHQFALESAKSAERGEKLVSYFIREYGTWKKADSHPNVVSVLGFVEAFQGSKLPGIVTEYYEKRDLRRYLKEAREAKTPIPEHVRLKLLVDAAAGLTHLHINHVFHRDIKASNIFVRSEGESLMAAIGDFGSAKLEDPDIFKITMSTVNTSLAWTPPEYILHRTMNYSTPTEAGDVWSFGCTILEVLTEEDPWPRGEDIRRRLVEKQHPPRPQGVREGIWELLSFCWKIESKRRRSAFIIHGLLKRELDGEKSLAS